jgi:hypothetical protein
MGFLYQPAIHPFQNQLPHFRQLNVSAIEKLDPAVAGLSVFLIQCEQVIPDPLNTGGRR